MTDSIPDPSSSNDQAPPSETDLLDGIERIVRMTRKSYGYQHLGVIGSALRAQYPDFTPTAYGCKTLLQFIEKHPERFKVKWSAPAHKGRSQVWVRATRGCTATEPKRKEGYADDAPKPAPLKPRLMTAAEFTRLCEWLEGPQGCHFRLDPTRPDDPEGIRWNCDGTLRKTRQWLKRRAFLSLNANLNVIRELGGYCDCEVLFNVAGRWPED
jgi:hypothetical protein